MEGSAIINIALAGDHALNLHALAVLLGFQGRFHVVSISGDAARLAQNIGQGGGESYPAIVLLDINFDLHQAAGIISYVKAAHPGIRLAALGLTSDREAIARLMQLGVDCYIPKNCDPGELEDVLIGLAGNGRVATPLMEQVGAWPVVTAAERRFFRLALSEASDDDIRRRMDLCKSTFTQLAARVYRLFGVRSRSGLVMALYRTRMVVMDDI